MSRKNTPPSRWDWLVSGLLILLGAALFLYLAVPSIALLPGDEWIYLKGSELLLQGEWPYRDFFLAHPPGRTLWGALILWLFRSPLAPKTFSMLLILATGLLLPFVVPGPRRRWPGALAAMLFLASNVAVASGPFFLGTSETTFLLVLGVFLAERERPLAAGLVHALSGFFAIYAAIPVLFYALFRGVSLPGRKRYFLGLAGVLVWFLPALAFGGKAFLDDTLLFHLRKTAMPDEPTSFGVVAWLAEWDYVPLVLPLLTFTNPRTFPWWPAAVGLAITVTIAAFPSIHSYYFLLPMPLLALGAGIGIQAFLDLLKQRLPRSILSPLVVAALATAVLSGVYRNADRHNNLRPTRAESEREIRALAERVDSCEPTQGALFGDSSIVPLLSLLTQRPVAGNLLDTNYKRFASGIASLPETLQTALDKDARVLVLVERHGLDTLSETGVWAQANFVLRTRTHTVSNRSVFRVLERGATRAD